MWFERGDYVKDKKEDIDEEAFFCQLVTKDLDLNVLKGTYGRSKGAAEEAYSGFLMGKKNLLFNCNCKCVQRDTFTIQFGTNCGFWEPKLGSFY